MPVSRAAVARIAGALLFATLPGACGARTELEVPPPIPPAPECRRHADCPGHDDPCEPVHCVDPEKYRDKLPELPAGVPLPPLVCALVAPVDCDDGDACTTDACNRETGGCEHTAATLDLDGDGHRAPLPGKKPGAPDACGDDCNDASPLAFPGNPEICDGVDNDCNGVVDDGAAFTPLEDEPVRVSDFEPAGPGGLAFGGDGYLAVYGGDDGAGDFNVFSSRLDPSGNKLSPKPQNISFQNADASGGPVVWVGDRYGVAWQDRREGNYEVYFTLLKPDGQKAIGDLRLTNAPGFSINVQLAWNGTEFIVVWQDDRNGVYQIWGQRLSVDGALLGENVQLTGSMVSGGVDDEAPVVASGTSSLGIAFGKGFSGQQIVRFRTVEHGTLAPRGGPIDLSPSGGEAVYPVVVWNEDRYVVAWFERALSPKAIYAAVVSEDAEILVPPTQITLPGGFRSRYPSLLPLGDRLLVVYADDRDGNDGYELYTRMVSGGLAPLGAESRLTTAPGDSIWPIATFGPQGNVGILFRDDRLGGAHHVYFTRLGCVTPPS
jgi:hypothetical protein